MHRACWTLLVQQSFRSVSFFVCFPEQIFVGILLLYPNTSNDFNAGTGAFLLSTLSTLHRRTSILQMLVHWTVTFFGNLAGSLFVVGILAGHGNIFSDPASQEVVIAVATAKAVTPAWHMVFIRGVGCNWLVALAVFFAFMAREYTGKVIAIWWPTFAFVCLGFDHVVANMFFIPMAIFEGTSDISIGYYIWKSMIPALIGNIVGGGLFVGVAYWYLYLLGETTPVMIDGVAFGVDISIGEDVGPRERANRRDNKWEGSSNEDKKKSPNQIV